MPSEDKAKRGAEFMMIFPLAGVFCMIGAFGWAIMKAQLEPGSMALGALGIVFFLTYFIRIELANLKHYLNVALYTLFVLGVCVTIYLGVRQNDRNFDVTAQSLHTLSEATTQYLNALNQEIEVVVFDTDREPYEDLLNRYSAINPRVTWSMHNPLDNPEFTMQFGVAVMNGVIWVTHGEKQTPLVVTDFDENALTNAIVEVTRKELVKIYFLMGHGELSPNMPKENSNALLKKRSLSGFLGFLSQHALEVGVLNLESEMGFIPDDASLIIIASPMRDLYDAEKRQLDRFLERGGRLMVLFDIPPLLDQAGQPFRNLSEMLRSRGINNTQRVILDMKGARDYNSHYKIPVSGYHPRHPITKPFASSFAPLPLGLVRYLEGVDIPDRQFRRQALVFTSPQAWSESIADSFNQTQVPSPDPKDLMQLPIGWTVEDIAKDGSGMRMAVFGSSAFVNNQTFSNSETAINLMMNTVNWLVDRGDLIAIPDRNVRGTPIFLENAKLQLILIVIVVAFPMTIFFGGIVYTSLLRRN